MICDWAGGRGGAVWAARWCFGMLFGVLFEVPVTVRAHVCNIDGQVLFGALFGG